MILLKGKKGIFHVIGKDIQNVFQNLFKQRYKWRREIRRYVASYYTEDASPAINQEKEVIYMVDGRMHHGGIGDRLRGIISTYDVCKKLNISFKINFISPFSLDLFFEPNKVDWRIKESDISYNSNDTLAIFCGSNGTHVERPFQRRWFVKNFKKNLKQVHIYTNAILVKPARFQQLFNELFRMSPILEDSVRHCTEEIGGKYIAITCRFQQLLGDFKEGDYEILAEDERETLIKAAIEEIEKIHKTHNEALPILLTSDSTGFLQRAKKEKPYVHIVEGELVHMDYSSEPATKLHLKSFTDLMMLSRAEKIYLLKSPKMYNSGFPRIAAMIGNKPFKLIRFLY